MSYRKRSPEQKILGRVWARWTEIVGLFARRRRARKNVDVHSYSELRRDLIERCRRLARVANEVDAPFYRYLEDLVQPWLDPSVLGRAERDILFDLLHRCQQAQDRLVGRSWLRSLPAVGIPLLVGASFFAIMLLWMGKVSVLLSTIMEFGRDFEQQVYIHAIRTSEVERLSILGLVLVIVAVIAVSRTARS
jgi:hypothetical protein